MPFRGETTREEVIMHDLTASSNRMVRAVPAAIQRKVVIERAADQLVHAAR